MVADLLAAALVRILSKFNRGWGQQTRERNRMKKKTSKEFEDEMKGGREI